MPRMFIIAGCNGAGKTTASFTILPEILDCADYVNSDEIAKGLSPFNPEEVQIEASKILICRMESLIKERKTFAIETTLSTKALAKTVVKAQKEGYFVTLLFLWLSIPELAVERVNLRVASGGHNVSKDIIVRRYGMGIDNLFKVYMPICDYWIVIDNSGKASRLVAEGGLRIVTKVHNKILHRKLLDYERTRDERDKG